VAFLRALERCGEVRRAAEDAAVDFSTAYARRKAHADFAVEWDAALAAFRARQRSEEAPPPCSTWSPAPATAGEARIAGGKLRRVGEGRWGKAKEEMFLAELHASGNFSRAARAIGMSPQAISRRRRNDPRLEQACEEAVAAAASRLGWMVVAAGNQAFDPDDLPEPGESPLPPVTVREAIDILKLRGWAPGPLVAEPEPVDMEAVRARLEQKMRMLGMLDEEPHPAKQGDASD
jgi:hypothetical protein